MKRQLPLPSVAVIALAISAVVPAVTLGLLTPLTGNVADKDPVTVLAMAVVFYPAAAGSALMFGFPTFLLFRRLGILRWWSTLLAGCIIAIVTVSIVSHQIMAARYLMLYAGIGAASALVFWAIWSKAVAGLGNVPNDA